jgi:hypothetical protein
MSLILLIKTSFAWSAFVLGAPMNAFLIWMIWRHTPKEMHVYSKILLQTCVTDLLLLLFAVLSDPVCMGLVAQKKMFFYKYASCLFAYYNKYSQLSR